MRRSVIRFAVLAVIGAVTVGTGIAPAQDVATNYVLGTDFSKFKTCQAEPEQGHGQAAQGLPAEGQVTTMERGARTMNRRTVVSCLLSLAISVEAPKKQGDAWKAPFLPYITGAA